MKHVGIESKFYNLDTFKKQIDVNFIDLDSELVYLNYKVASLVFCHFWRSIILRNCRHFSCILCTTKIHTTLSLKKIKSSSLGKATYSSYQIVEYILVCYVTNIVNYFVLFFNVLDLYIFLLNDIDVITSKNQTWKVIKVFIIIITIIIYITTFET